MNNKYTITGIRYRNDNIALVTASNDRIELTYNAWIKFLQARGALSLPFTLSLDHETSGPGLIRDASNLRRQKCSQPLSGQ
jgi:hypothetical protein